MSIQRIADDFLNIRGSFRIGGLIDIGTQASLVRRASGSFVFLDSCAMSDAVQREVDALTNGGRDVEAILNLHPFHTVHVRAMHERYPRAKLYGTARHLSRFPDLPWQKTRTEQRRLHTMFAKDFEFSVPRGVDFISANENVHFSSVLVLHRASQTIHVDDTLMYSRLPLPMRMLGLSGHPAFSSHVVARHWKSARGRAGISGTGPRSSPNAGAMPGICAPLIRRCSLQRSNRGASIHDRILTALDRVSVLLR